MKEKIHDLKTALEVLRVRQTVSFDDCQKLMTDVHDKTGFTPPNFEISGNQWCALVNLAIARFGSTPPQRTWVELTHEKRVSIICEDENRSLLEHCERIEQVLKEDNGA